MTQTAVVRERLPDGRVMVAVRRPSACGHDCASCGGLCAPGAPLLATAHDPLGAQEGDIVIVESSTRRVLGLAGLAYLCPVLLFFVGCAASALWKLPETAGGSVGFLLGLLPAIVAGRRLKRRGGVEVTVVEIETKSQGG